MATTCKENNKAPVIKPDPCNFYIAVIIVQFVTLILIEPWMDKLYSLDTLVVQLIMKQKL